MDLFLKLIYFYLDGGPRNAISDAKSESAMGGAINGVSTTTAVRVLDYNAVIRHLAPLEIQPRNTIYLLSVTTFIYLSFTL